MPGNAVQGIVYFDGMQGVISGSFTLQHGVTPSRALIYMVPQQQPMPTVGTLAFLTDRGDFILFPDCHAKSLEVEINGLVVWAVTIMDFRWRWCYGEISGEYNVRDANGRLIEESIKNPQQLAAMLFEAMGQARFDVRRMPTNIFPEKKWDTAHAHHELQTLCDECGCTIVPNPGNNVAIWPKGVGAGLPADQLLTDAQILFDIPDVPDFFIFRGSRDQFQFPLKLEAVAEDVDGEIKPLNDVSYAPPVDPAFPALKKHPWGPYSPPFADAIFPKEVDPRKQQKRMSERDLANKWVFRAYRILPTTMDRALKDKPLDIDRWAIGTRWVDEVREIERLLPLNNTRLVRESPFGEKDPLRKVRKEPLPAVVFGRWAVADSAATGTNLDALRTMTFRQSSEESKDLEKRRKPTGQFQKFENRFELYQQSFQLDIERGIVFFAEPVFETLVVDVSDETDEADLVGDAPPVTEQTIKVPALLYLLTSFGVRDKFTRAWTHRDVYRKLPGPKYNTKPRTIYQTDVSYDTFHNPAVRGLVSTNEKDFLQQAEFYLNAEQAKLTSQLPASGTWAGFRPILLDGAIRQVTWFVDDRGYHKTRASRNREEPTIAQTYQQQRLNEQLVALFASNAKEALKEKDKFSG